jgi:H+-translocating NAD(P) transhydrogenase subunit alpha
MKAGVVKETAPGERRVALVPDAIARLRPAGIDVLVESGAGDGAWLTDAVYADAGAAIVSPAELYRSAEVILTVTKPSAAMVAQLKPGQAIVGMLAPLSDPELAAALAAQGVTAISLDGLPRTLSRTQPMDALSSQSNVAGYKAALVGATAFSRFFPMLITAAGTARPAKVLVLGTGVAGLQAIGTARRLGAVVSGYDVRPSSKTEVESLGATFVELTAVGDAAGEGGYARELTIDERQAQQDELAGHIARHDVVITTAQVPGRRPPLLVTEDAIKAMSPGSVIVDMGASALGGNVAGSRPDETIITSNGITIIGADNLPATVPAAASAAYSRNIAALLLHLTSDGALAIDTGDEIQAGVVITHGGRVVHQGVADLLASRAAPAPPTAPPPGAQEDPYRELREDLYTRPGEDLYTGPRENLYNRPQEDLFTRAPENLYTEPREGPFTEPQEDLFARPDEDPFTRPDEDPFTRPDEDPFTEPEEDFFATPEEDLYTGSEENLYTEPEAELPPTGGGAGVDDTSN